MDLQTRALYNLIYFNLLQDQAIQCEHWQKEDYRSLSDDQLFEGMKALGFSIDEAQLFTFIEDADTPEALTEFFIEEKNDPASYDALYLFLFEFWRRHFPEKKTLSLFCDEFDHLIYLYDNNLLDSDEALQDDFENLKVILEDSIDEGQTPKNAWLLINQYCAHNLSTFIYDYISDLIENGSEKYASELIEGFYPFVEIERWFDILRVRTSDHEDELERVSALVDSLLKTPDFDLQIEVLDFLAQTPYSDLFMELFPKTLYEAEDAESLLELIDICTDFYSDDPLRQQKLSVLAKQIEKGGELFSPDYLQTFSQIIK